MTACEEATPAPEDPAPPIKPAGIPPSVYEELGDVALAASGAKATLALDLDHHFYDPDGKDGEENDPEGRAKLGGSVKRSPGAPGGWLAIGVVHKIRYGSWNPD